MKETKKPAADPPLEGVTNLGELAAGFVCGAIVGGVIGLGVAEYLRARGLVWTWALALAPASLLIAAGVLVSPLAGWPAASVVGGAFGTVASATGWGAHRRLEDRRSGSDRESSARERRGVLDGPRRRVRERPAKRREALVEGIPIGRARRGDLAFIKRGTRENGSHVLIPGATGAGKTTSLGALLVDYVARSGFGAVVIEAKIDERLRVGAEAAAAARGVGFRLVSPEGPCGYDPIAQGSVDERSERLTAVQAWGSDDADFYRQTASPFLRLVMRALDHQEGPTTLRAVAQTCDPDLLRDQVAAADFDDPQLREEIAKYNKGLQRDDRRAIGGLRGRLFNLANSEFARDWLDPTNSQGRVVDLRKSVAAREVVYYRLDTDRTGMIGKDIAQMVMLDLGAIASSMMHAGVGTLIAIDEFGAISGDALDRLYVRGRSAGMSVALGTQTIADLREAGPATRERVGATIESVVCHRIGNQEDAEWLAQLIGTVPTWQTTTRTDRLGLSQDEGTRTRGYQWEVHPSQLQRLDRGRAYVARLDVSGEVRAHSVEVVPPWQRLPGIEEAA